MKQQKIKSINNIEKNVAPNRDAIRAAFLEFQANERALNSKALKPLKTVKRVEWLGTLHNIAEKVVSKKRSEVTIKDMKKTSTMIETWAINVLLMSNEEGLNCFQRYQASKKEGLRFFLACFKVKTDSEEKSFSIKFNIGSKYEKFLSALPKAERDVFLQSFVKSAIDKALA